MLRPKQGKTQNWLPQQVAYGMDCSDADPKNWKPFGTVVEKQQAVAKSPTKDSAPKTD